jgi:hypothetical protein
VFFSGLLFWVFSEENVLRFESLGVPQRSVKLPIPSVWKNTCSCVVAQASLSSLFEGPLFRRGILNLRALVAVALVISLYVLVVSVPSQVNALGPIAGCTSLPPTSAGSVQATFDSVSLFQFYPQSCSFNVLAKTSSPGLLITQLSWQFGDGASLDVPYCCQSHVSEVRYHAYAQPGTYTVSVTVLDNMGNVGSTQVIVTW